MQDIVLDSRHGHQTNGFSRFGNFFKSMLLALILGLLFGLDFVLYLRSGTVQLFDGSWNTSVFLVLAMIVIGAIAAMLSLFFSRGLQKMLFAFGCAALVWGFFCQFLQIDKTQYLGVLLSPMLGYEIASLTDGYSHWIICGLVFVLTYIIAGKLSKTSMLYFIGSLLLIIGGFLAFEMFDAVKKPAFKEVYKATDSGFSEKNKKVVFLFMPNMTSFSAINAGLGKDLDKSKLLRNVELGFFMKNGFKFYPNAYVPNENKDANLIELLNILDNKPYYEHVLNSTGLEKLWKFKSPQRTDVFLQDSQMQDVFRKAGFKLSAYQSQNIEICKKNNQYAVDRCINTQSLPVDVTKAKFSEQERATLLLKQWLSSLGFVDNRTVAGGLQYVLDRQTVQNVFLPYERMYVVNSLQILQTVLENISSDKGAGVYFVYLNFPDNLLIYDEYCGIKPQTEWNSLMPSVKLPMIARNTKEYNEQMLCLFGQLSDFMSSLQELKPDDNITVILQGLSGKKVGAAENLNFVEKFKEQNMVMTAIRDGNSRFGVSNKICNSKDILRSYLFKAKGCDEFSGVKVSNGTQETLRSELKNDRINKSMLPEAVSAYDNWLQQWKENKKLSVIKLKKAIVEQVKVKAEEKPQDKDSLQSEMAVRALVDNLDSTVSPEKTTDTTEKAKAEVEKSPKVEAKTEVEDVPLEHSGKNKVKPELQPQAEENRNEVVNKDETVKSEPVAPVVREKADENKPKERVVPAEDKTAKASETEKKVEEKVATPTETPEVSRTEPVAPTEAKIEPKSANQPVEPTKPETKPEPVKAAAEQPKAVAVETKVEEKATPTETVEIKEKQVTSHNQPQAKDDSNAENSVDFLLEDEEDEWELDPAKALGVSGDEQKPEEKIIVKVK